VCAGVIGCSATSSGNGNEGDGGSGTSDGSTGQGTTDGSGQDSSVAASDASTNAEASVPLGDAGTAVDAANAADAASVGDATVVADGGVSEAGAADAASEASADAGGAGPEQCVNRAPVAAKWALKWSDEFDKNGAPDPSNWGYESGFVRNEELQWYQPNNATVSDGLLTIAAQRQQVTNPNYVAGSSDWKTSRQYAQYTSSSMTTSGKRSFEYGRFELCGQIDTRQGSWPAFWILGNGRSWPASGEVDIMEYYASDIRANVCTPSGSTCDWNGSVAQPISKFASTWPSQFHLWAMEWDSTDISLYLDDALVWTFKVSSVTSGTNPYTGNPFYILVNQAIGANGGDPTNTTFPITYKVDYVRVYQ
jgi:beta-glucanase (GH16 family)